MTVETEATQAPTPLPPSSVGESAFTGANGMGGVGVPNNAISNHPQCYREKYWEECTVEEKLERVRDTLVSIDRDQVQVGESLHRLLRHSHSPSGEPVTPVATPSKEDYEGYSRNRTHSIKNEYERGRR